MENWPFRESVSSLCPYISNTVRAVARYCCIPKFVYWKSALGILAYIKETTIDNDITFQREPLASVFFEVFADDADYASKANGRWSVSDGAVMCG